MFFDFPSNAVNPRFSIAGEKINKTDFFLGLIQFGKLYLFRSTPQNPIYNCELVEEYCTMATASTEQTAALQQQLVKEYKWFNSHSLPLELQVGVTRLELSDQVNTVINGLENFIVTSHIIFNQLKAHDPPMSTLFSQPDHRRNSLIWDQVLCFPIKIRDLTLDSILVFTVWSADGVSLGGTSMRLFDDAGCLKQGKQKLLFFHETEGDQNVLIQYNKTPGEYYEIFAKHDYDFFMEKNFEKYRYFQASEMKPDYRHEWLDRLLLKRIEQAQEIPIYGDRTSAELKEFSQKYRNEFWGTSLEEVEMKKYSFLVIELPTLAHQVCTSSFVLLNWLSLILHVH